MDWEALTVNSFYILLSYSMTDWLIDQLIDWLIGSHRALSLSLGNQENRVNLYGLFNSFFSSFGFSYIYIFIGIAASLVTAFQIPRFTFALASFCMFSMVHTATTYSMVHTYSYILMLIQGANEVLSLIQIGLHPWRR